MTKMATKMATKTTMKKMTKKASIYTVNKCTLQDLSHLW